MIGFGWRLQTVFCCFCLWIIHWSMGRCCHELGQSSFAQLVRMGWWDLIWCFRCSREQQPGQVLLTGWSPGSQRGMLGWDGSSRLLTQVAPVGLAPFNTVQKAAVGHFWHPLKITSRITCKGLTLLLQTWHTVKSAHFKIKFADITNSVMLLSWIDIQWEKSQVMLLVLTVNLAVFYSITPKLAPEGPRAKHKDVLQEINMKWKHGQSPSLTTSLPLPYTPRTHPFVCCCFSHHRLKKDKTKTGWASSRVNSCQAAAVVTARCSALLTALRINQSHRSSKEVTPDPCHKRSRLLLKSNWCRWRM